MSIGGIGELSGRAAERSGGDSFSQMLHRDASEREARGTLEAMAGDPGNSGLKLRLAEEGISLSDPSDVGPGQRFGSFGDKLGHVMDRKAAYILAIRMAMVSGGGWGPSNDESIASAKASISGSDGKSRAAYSDMR